MGRRHLPATEACARLAGRSGRVVTVSSVATVPVGPLRAAHVFRRCVRLQLEPTLPAATPGAAGTRAPHDLSDFHVAADGLRQLVLRAAAVGLPLLEQDPPDRVELGLYRVLGLDL